MCLRDVGTGWVQGITQKAKKNNTVYPKGGIPPDHRTQHTTSDATVKMGDFVDKPPHKKSGGAPDLKKTIQVAKPRVATGKIPKGCQKIYLAKESDGDDAETRPTKGNLMVTLPGAQKPMVPPKDDNRSWGKNRMDATGISTGKGQNGTRVGHAPLRNNQNPKGGQYKKGGWKKKMGRKMESEWTELVKLATGEETPWWTEVEETTKDPKEGIDKPCLYATPKKACRPEGNRDKKGYGKNPGEKTSEEGGKKSKTAYER